MPIQIKTMRDLWDQKREGAKENVTKPIDIPEEIEIFNTKETGEIQAHFLDYLARNQAFIHHKAEMSKIFSDYKKRLREGGFL